MPELTLGEIGRRLDDVVTQFERRLDAMLSQFERLASQAEQTYLRRDLYEAKHLTDLHSIATLEDKIRTLEKQRDQADQQRRNDRRLIFSALVAPVLVAVVVLVITTWGKP